MATTTYGPTEGRPHTHTIIILHGRDSAADEFASGFFESEASGPDDQDRTLLGLFPTVRWVFPTATSIRSERFDTTMLQWFDMWSVEDPEEKTELQQEGLRESILRAIDVLRCEEALVPREKIFLAGISQGFATAVAAFFADGRGVAGLIGLCSWLPMASSVEEIARACGNKAEAFTALQKLYTGVETLHLEAENQAHFRTVPLMLAHSLDDEIVPIANGRRLKDAMENLGFDVDWHEYSQGGHWVNEPEGVDDMVHFIKSNMMANNESPH